MESLTYEKFEEVVYSIEIKICKEPDDSSFRYSVFSNQLPGLFTEGNTIEECRRYAVEAATGLIGSYLDAGKEIPWGERTGWGQIIHVPKADCV